MAVASPPPQVGPQEAGIDEDEQYNYSPTIGQSGSAPSGGCGTSSLGYACSQALGDGQVTLGWSLGTEAPPDNACTRLAGNTSAPAGAKLHMAIQTQAPGYVSLAFAAEVNVMGPADVILGEPRASKHGKALHAPG